MKPHERLARIRASKSWSERLALARDRVPGTRFDWLIPHLLGALRSLEEHSKPRGKYMLPSGQIDLAKMAKDDLAAFGQDLVSAIQTGNSKLFRDWSDAVEAWHGHKPMEDKHRAAIIRFCVPPKGEFTMRAIVAHLVEIGLVRRALKSGEHDDLRRTIRRIASELGIKISGLSRRPSKTGRRLRPRRKSKS